MISIETFIALFIIAIPIGIYLGIITTKKKDEPEQSQRDKDIEKLIDEVGKLMESEGKRNDD